FSKLVSRHNQFTTEQARQLLEAFDSDSRRVEAAVTLYPRVKDAKYFFQALDAFDTDSGRMSARQQLKLDWEPKGLTEDPGERVSRQELQSLVRGVKNESTDASRLTLIRMIAHGRAF